ncbi:YfiT family bacillithiol transferase [Paenibacillus sp. FSL R7-0216]|uniref:YfiT family bacillithiol transferase n=1 Tax=Paenibacillus sp. FSL R7-0216 TaxID=2921677 RepID=UPI0030D8C0A8
MIDKTRYPIGQFQPALIFSEEDRDKFINQILLIIPKLRNLISHLTIDQLQTPYRNGGWSIQQIIHHMADNDMNAYLRFKRALTEIEPSASSYREDLWGDLHDYFETDIEISLLLLESLHKRFYILLHKLDSGQFSRTLRTQALGLINLDTALQRFIWHNHHHISQIESLIIRKAW